MGSELPNAKKKREYRKGSPLTGTEYSRRYKQRKYKDSKELRVFIPADLKDQVASWCTENGTTQTDLLVALLTKHLRDVESNS
jgi:hypothetical protein